MFTFIHLYTRTYHYQIINSIFVYVFIYLLILGGFFIFVTQYNKRYILSVRFILR